MQPTRGRTMARHVILLVCIASAARVSSGHGTGGSGGEDGRIHVPLHRRLADAVVSGGEGGSRGRTRRYAVEADVDDGTGPSSGTRRPPPATLLVRDVARPAVTERTTYSFASGTVDPSRAAGDTLLASDPGDGGGLTILSIDRTTGDVRGVRRDHGGRSSVISLDEAHRIRMRRSAGGEETGERRSWACDAAHGHDHDHGEEEAETAKTTEGPEGGERRDVNTRAVAQAASNGPEPEPLTRPALGPITPGTTHAPWARPEPYSFNVDMVIQTDSVFIANQGGIDGAVRYINFLVSAMNVVFEHEVDAHLVGAGLDCKLLSNSLTFKCRNPQLPQNVVHIEEKDWYDSLTTVRDALRIQRAQPNKVDNGRGGITLYHAILGRYLGGGIGKVTTKYCERLCLQSSFSFLTYARMLL